MAGQDYETPASEIIRSAEEANAYTMLFAEYRNQRWWRGREVVDMVGSPESAMEQFWLDRDSQTTLLSCCLRGNVRTVDDFEFADEPRFDSGTLEVELGRYPEEGSDRYTVFTVWRSIGDASFKRNCHMVTAADAYHAELLARRGKFSGTLLVVGVVELYVSPDDDPEVYEYATPDGRPHESESTVASRASGRGGVEAKSPGSHRGVAIGITAGVAVLALVVLAFIIGLVL